MRVTTARFFGTRICFLAGIFLGGLMAGFFFGGAARAADDLIRRAGDFDLTNSHARLALEAGRIVQVGQFAPGTELQELKFSKPVKCRFFCLDVLSSQDGKPYAAVAELELLDEFGQPLNHDGWKMVYADSEERRRENGAATNAIDRDVTTYWHTQWSDESPNFPHRLILDLGRAAVITAFRYLPRQGDPGAAGRIKDYQISIADQLKTEQPLVELLPEKCFIFSYFTDDGAGGLRLAWSLNGYQWEPLNRGQSIFQPTLGGTNLMRDPCLLRGPDGTFHLVWTTAWTGSSIGYASSKDLIHWSSQKIIRVMADEPGTRNCWAPEVYWDAPRDQFLIIWASAVDNRFDETLGQLEGAGNQRIYFTTTKDFTTFAPPKLFYDPGFSVIDPTLVAAKGRYYLYFKDETSRPKKKDLGFAVGDNPLGPFRLVSKSFSPSFVEGPEHLCPSKHWLQGLGV